jgi:nucleotide-binding universal stress UspA family protein
MHPRRTGLMPKEDVMYQRIVVPLDGSELAEKALPEAEQMARLTGGTVHLVRVVDLVQLPWYDNFATAIDYGTVQAAISGDENAAATYLREVSARLTEAGITTSVETCRGLVPREIVAATKPGDLIVMASHGRSGVTRWLLGSVAEEVLRHASVPVLLVRAGASSDDAARTTGT